MNAPQSTFAGSFEELLDAMPDGIVVVDGGGRIQYANDKLEAISGYSAVELVGMSVEELVPDRFRAGHAAHRGAYGANPAVRQMGSHLDIRFRRKDGSEFAADIALSPVTARGGIRVLAAIRDITERRRQDDRVRAMLDVAQSILEGGEDATVLEVIVGRARALFDADLAAVAVSDPDADQLRVMAAAGSNAAALHGLPLPSGAASIEGGARSSEPTVVEDVSADQTLAGPMLAPAGAGPALIVPLHSGGHLLGVLAIANERGGGGFSEQDVHSAELFAAQAAVAMDFTRVRQDLERLAVLEDRERIGRELHDGAIQALFAVGMNLQGLALMTSDSTLRERLDGSVAQIDDVIRDLRNYIFGLRPGLAADRHLARALQDLGRQLEQQHGVACAVDVDQDLAARLSAIAGDIVQLTREALSNVGRHAAAQTCRVSLRPDSGAAILEIADDGRGFEQRKMDGNGWGLRNMEQRATTLGGSLELDSVPGEGTTLRVSIPVA